MLLPVVPVVTRHVQEATDERISHQPGQAHRSRAPVMRPGGDLHAATTSQAVIDQAGQQLAGDTDLTVPESVRLVRFTARIAGVAVVDVANAVLAGVLSTDDLLWPAVRH